MEVDGDKGIGLLAELILATDQSDEEVEAEVRGWFGYSSKDYWRETQTKAAKGIEVQIDPKNPFAQKVLL